MNSIEGRFTDDIGKNSQMLIEQYGMKKEGDIARTVGSFTVNGIKTFVVPGKFKSALIFWNLAVEANTDGVHNRPFILTQKMRDKIREYFTSEICKDAEENPETKHTTVRALLQEGKVTTISITRVAHH